MNQYWWIPVIFIWQFCFAYISKKTQMSSGYSTWFYTAALYGAIPFWAIVAKSSKNLPVDGIIYDTFVMLGFFIGLFFLGETKDFTMTQVIGLCMALVGLLLLKTGV